MCMGAVATCVYIIKVINKQNEWRMTMVIACNAFFNVIQRLRLKALFCTQKKRNLVRP